MTTPPISVHTPHGTYILEGAYRRMLRRSIAVALIFFALMISSAAVIGFYRAATHHNSTKSDISFNDGWNTGLQDLRDIQAKPGGDAKIAHCFQIAYNADSFHTCIDR